MKGKKELGYLALAEVVKKIIELVVTRARQSLES